MDYNDVLKKTLEKSKRTVITRLPASIATDDRPYGKQDLTEYSNNDLIKDTNNAKGNDQ